MYPFWAGNVALILLVLGMVAAHGRCFKLLRKNFEKTYIAVSVFFALALFIAPPVIMYNAAPPSYVEGILAFVFAYAGLFFFFKINRHYYGRNEEAQERRDN